jgi:hypothetical protein
MPVTPATATKPVWTGTPMVTATIQPIPLPYDTPTLPPTTTETPTLTLLPTPIVGTSAVSEGLWMAFVIDGNLYVQNGNAAPMQLTTSGKDWHPIFSDDGEKIVFYSNRDNHTGVYSINTDGRQERVIISGSLLTALNLVYNESTGVRSLVFVTGSHQLLFNTLNPDRTDGPEENEDLLLVNAENGEIKQLLARGQGGEFKASPDGKLVAILAKDHIKVINIDGQVIYRDLVTYPAIVGQSVVYIGHRIRAYYL